MGRVDLAILHEIVRVVQAKAAVPEKISLQKHSYALTYLEDHRQRMEEALRRHDPDRLNMLFGQLASKVKYQLIRTVVRPAATPAKTKGAKTKPSPRAAKASARTAKGSPRTTKGSPRTTKPSPHTAKPAARKAAARRATTRKR